MEVDKDVNKTYYICCNLILKTPYQMNKHLSTEKRRQFIGVCNKCIICGARRSYLKNLKEHLKNDHPNVYTSIYGLITGVIEQIHPSSSNFGQVSNDQLEFDNEEEVTLYDDEEIPYYLNVTNLEENNDPMKKFCKLLTRLRLEKFCTQKSLNANAYEILKFIFEEIFKDSSSDIYNKIIKISKSTLLQQKYSNPLTVYDNEKRCYYFDLRELIECKGNP